MSPRGAGYLFGSDVVAQFNASNDIDMICRAHQLVMEGYKWHFNETVLTVWSAPNYCYRSAARQAHAKHTLRGWEGGGGEEVGRSKRDGRRVLVAPEWERSPRLVGLGLMMGMLTC